MFGFAALVGWLIGCLVGLVWFGFLWFRLVSLGFVWLVCFLVGWFFGLLVFWLVGWLVGWSNVTDRKLPKNPKNKLPVSRPTDRTDGCNYMPTMSLSQGPLILAVKPATVLSTCSGVTHTFLSSTII